VAGAPEFCLWKRWILRGGWRWEKQVDVGQSGHCKEDAIAAATVVVELATFFHWGDIYVLLRLGMHICLDVDS
jgi:hypothetical protein